MEENNIVTILIPAYNEASTIKDTVLAVKNIKKIDQVIVINDCSSDDTAKLAEEAGAEVISLETNLGKGGALNYGLNYAKGNIIGLLDGDLGKTAIDVEKLLDPVLTDKADMTIGRFPPAKKRGGFGLVTELAKRGIRWYTGLEVNSPLSGQRVIRKTVLDRIGPFESGFGVEVGLTIDVFRNGFRVKEIPVQMSHAETGRDLAGFIHRGKQFIDVLKVLLKRLAKR
ncbi:MAG TPA: glycosyltransferase family 2 protein [Bacillota bacterium]|nr:glycosyltransferase family 2 protein [Bacillota bacterium]HOL09218.1 glycosyltransferase family 2 protein [Bacillota bacterium]HPO97042.1 glycosyltransferase family 2 protein [Bacillota bacterium]